QYRGRPRSQEGASAPPVNTKWSCPSWRLTAASQLGMEGPRPELPGQTRRVSADPVIREIITNVLDIALEQSEGAGVRVNIHGLRKVDDLDRAVPIQDIERREIAVDQVARERDFHVPQNALEERAYLARTQSDADQL